MHFSSGYPGADRTIDIPPGVDRIGETRRAWDVDNMLMFMRPGMTATGTASIPVRWTTAWFVMAINGFNPYSFNH